MADKKRIRTLLGLHLLLLVFSFCGIFSKTAAMQPFLSLKWCLCYGAVILILGIYAIFWQQIIRVMPLNTAYLNKSVTMIWAAIWGMLFFHERIRMTHVVGGVLVMVGVLLVITESNESTD